MTIEPEDEQTVLSALRLSRILLRGFIDGISKGAQVRRAEFEPFLAEAKSRLHSTCKLLNRLRGKKNPLRRQGDL